VGVAAEPLENDLFTWHANIKGPENTKYEGGLFHFVIEIPRNYPHRPPKLTLSTPITHPNVFGNTICLDML
jgi:ubiquitin-protein ligase